MFDKELKIYYNNLSGTKNVPERYIVIDLKEPGDVLVIDKNSLKALVESMQEEDKLYIIVYKIKYNKGVECGNGFTCRLKDLVEHLSRLARLSFIGPQALDGTKLFVRS